MLTFHMSVPKLTIPETAFDPSVYSSRSHKSSLLVFLIRLTNSSGLLVLLFYVIGYLGIKPLLELTSARRLEVLEVYRSKLRDLYLSLVSRLDHIPIVGFPQNGRVTCDSIMQTESSYFKRLGKLTAEEKLDELNKSDKLSQMKLLSKLQALNGALEGCTSYSVAEMPHYKYARETVKSFQNEIDTKLFTYDELYRVETLDPSRKHRDLVVDTKNDIRSIKGLYMSGKA